MAFITETRRLFNTRPAIGYRSAGLRVQELPQSHLLAAVHLLCSGTITATALAALTNGYNPDYGPPPFSIIRRIRLRNNIGLNLCDVSAWGLFLQNLTETRVNVAVNDPDGFNHTGAAAAPFVRYFRVPATSGTSATFVFAVTIPVALGAAALTGLQNLQSPNVRYTLEIEWGAVTDITGGTSPAIAEDTGASVTPVLELYTIPNRPEDWPDFGVTRLIQEDRQSITQTGEQTYRPVLGPNYNKIIFEMINNGQPIPMANITNLRTRFAQAQEFFTMNPDVQAYLQRKAYGVDLPESVYVFDYLLGNGVPELPSGRDIIDTSRITDFEYLITTTAAISGTSYMRVIKDFLSPSGAA